LAPCRKIAGIKNVRVLGAIGVVELERLTDAKALQRACVAAGIWVRPFRDIIYLTPSFTIDEADLARLTGTIVSVLA
jgi:adenosylmethionine-8-amino-7-oxononanoate aminotransferase